MALPTKPVADAFTIDNFRSNVTNVARPYLFYVSFPQMNFTFDGGSASLDPHKMIYLVQSSKIPSRTVSNLDVRWQGYTYSFGGVSTWEDWSCTFLLDSELTGYDAFRAWVHYVHNPRSNVHGDPEKYITNGIQIQQLDHKGQGVIAEFTLVGAWPTSVNGYELSYGSTDSAATFDANFKYVYALDSKFDPPFGVGTV